MNLNHKRHCKYLRKGKTSLPVMDITCKRLTFLFRAVSVAWRRHALPAFWSPKLVLIFWSNFNLRDTLKKKWRLYRGKNWKANILLLDQYTPFLSLIVSHLNYDHDWKPIILSTNGTIKRVDSSLCLKSIWIKLFLFSLTYTSYMS